MRAGAMGVAGPMRLRREEAFTLGQSRGTQDGYGKGAQLGHPGGVLERRFEMNFTIGWIIGITSIVLAVIAAFAWASGTYGRRKDAQKGK